jgi:hypothetical protein
MKIVVDEKKLARNSKLARTIVLGTVAVALGLMIAVLVAISSTSLRTIDPAIILVGELVIIALMFIFARIGFDYASRYLSIMRPEKVFRESLKGLDRKFTLSLFEKPVDYFLVEPGGITVLIARPQDGPVRFKDGKWNTNRNFLRVLMGRDEAIGDPVKDANAAMAEVKKRLESSAPDIKVPLRAAVVFVNPNVKLEAEPSPVVAVLRADQLKDYVRLHNKLNELPKSIQRKMRTALGVPETEGTES